MRRIYDDQLVWREACIAAGLWVPDIICDVTNSFIEDLSMNQVRCPACAWTASRHDAYKAEHEVPCPRLGDYPAIAAMISWLWTKGIGLDIRYSIEKNWRIELARLVITTKEKLVKKST
jgi:hypothetical protein